MRQDQFLTVVGREEARRRFDEALRPAPVGIETVPLGEAHGRVLARALAAPIDVPPFDRSTVDGFAVRAADVATASETAPVRLAPTGDVVACGVAPTRAVDPGTATTIATGGPMPRGADAVVMVEQTEPDGAGGVLVRRPVASGQNMAFAGSDLAQGETVLRRGKVIGAPEIGLMAACGTGTVEVFRRPIVAVISTGDELVPPGGRLGPAAIYDTNGPIVAAAVAENGCVPLVFPIVPDDEARLRAALTEAHARADFVILSGGTSKGTGDLTARLVAGVGAPGIVVHGVAVKPGKPLCLAVADGKGLAVLPGFPTSAMFTFHEFIVPVLRRLAGLAPRREGRVEATVPVRVPSEIGRTDYVMVGLGTGADDGLVAHPVFKGSGAISAFAQADGFVAIEALADHLAAGSVAEVTLFSPEVRAPDLVIAGSHCVGLEPVVDAVIAEGFDARILALGSTGGLAAARRGECDVAPIHLLDAASGIYNQAFLDESLELVPGWRRLQGVVFRPGDRRFEGRTAAEAVAAIAEDPTALMVNRNTGAGTRLLLDGLLGGRRPDGWTNQAKSHNAVAAAVAHGRADWGMAIATVAKAYGLGFLPFADEHYDFAVVRARRDRPAVAAFLLALASAPVRERLAALGFAVARGESGSP
ncbi:molybdopterin biosynthesis protein [Siculibacillus lacustris]|nr:molybdopterin biosynthesis protein [Siculibacillus lacustris]